MAEILNLSDGRKGAEGVAGCKEIMFQSTQALLLHVLWYKYDTRIDKITNKANSTLVFLGRNISRCPTTIKAQCYSTLVRPTIEYVSSVWSPAKKENVKKLEAVQRRKDDMDELELFDYGPPNGHPEARRHLAEFLTSQYIDNVENLFFTAGATQGIHLVTTVLMSADTPIFVEDPSYFQATRMFKEDFRYPVIPVPTDEYGIDVDALEKLLQETPAPAQTKSPFRRMLYTMTVYHNPKGVCLPPEKCRRLVSLARQYDMLLFCEDVYNLLTYTDNGVPPPRLLSYDNKEDPDYKGNTLSNCTFSKIFSPGVRVGWIEAGPRIIQLLIDCFTTTSGLCYNHYMSCVIGKALELGLIGSNLSRLKTLYGERMKTACRRLRENQLPVSFVEPKGGFFIWLQLPEHMDGKDLCEQAKAANVLVQVGSKASVSGGWKNFIRLSISVCPVDKIEKGIDKLSEIIRSNTNQKV